MAEFPGAKDKFVDEDRVWIDQNDHVAIVIHGTGGNPNQTADQLGDYFETTPLKTSVHYGIDRLGNIDQYVLEKDGAGGNGFLDPGHDPFWDQYADNPNWHTLSVETENDQTNSLPLTDPQKQTLFKLIKYWIDKYNIPLSNIKGHFTLQPVERHNCPGPNFPWKDLFDYLANGGNQPVSTQPNANQQKAADDCWDSVLKNSVPGPAPKGTGIYQAWLGALTQGKQYGPPITHEYDSVDWNGNPIVVQEFAHARCEWKPGIGGGLLGWYGANGGF